MTPICPRPRPRGSSSLLVLTVRIEEQRRVLHLQVDRRVRLPDEHKGGFVRHAMRERGREGGTAALSFQARHFQLLSKLSDVSCGDPPGPAAAATDIALL